MKKTNATTQKMTEVRKAVKAAQKRTNTISVETLQLKAVKNPLAGSDLDAAVKAYATACKKAASLKRSDPQGYKDAVRSAKKEADKALSRAVNAFEFSIETECAIELFKEAAFKASCSDNCIRKAEKLLGLLGLEAGRTCDFASAVVYLCKMVPMASASNLATLKGTISKQAGAEWHRTIVKMVIAFNYSI